MKANTNVNRPYVLFRAFVNKGAILLIMETILSLSLLAGCKDECDSEIDDTSVKVNVTPQWEQAWERDYGYGWRLRWNNDWQYTYDDLRPEPATGIRVLVYSGSDGAREHNIPAEGGYILMKENADDALFYNNDTKYIVFDNTMYAATATATTRGVNRPGFQPMHSGERTVNPPDMLYGAFVEEYAAKRTQGEAQLTVTMRPLVYTYVIRYGVEHGKEYVALARGALAGMAEAVHLNDGHTDEKAATIVYDCTLEDYGAEAIIRSFGIPNHSEERYRRSEEDMTDKEYALNLEVRLTNGKIRNFVFDVTSQVKKQPRGGVIVVSGINISDEEGMENSGSFDIDTEGWGDFIDIPLELE